MWGEVGGPDRLADFFARIARPPVGMVHHKGARLAELLMPHVICGAHREARVPRRRMNVDLLERSRIKNFPARHAIESHTPGETNGLESRSLGKLFQHAEINFF